MSNLMKRNVFIAAFCLIGYAVSSLVVPAEQVPISTPLSEAAWSGRIASTKTSEGDDAETEFRLPDGSRVDITTRTHAYEVEFCGPKHPGKWKESIGQSLFYAIQTGKKPGIILLLEDGSEETKLDYLRCLVVCKSEGIKLETWNVSRGK